MGCFSTNRRVVDQLGLRKCGSRYSIGLWTRHLCDDVLPDGRGNRYERRVEEEYPTSFGRIDAHVFTGGGCGALLSDDIQFEGVVVFRNGIGPRNIRTVIHHDDFKYTFFDVLKSQVVQKLREFFCPVRGLRDDTHRRTDVGGLCFCGVARRSPTLDPVPLS